MVSADRRDSQHIRVREEWRKSHYRKPKQPKREPDQGVEQRECGLQAVVQLQHAAESAERRWLAGTLRQLVAKYIRATVSVRTN